MVVEELLSYQVMVTTQSCKEEHVHCILPVLVTGPGGMANKQVAGMAQLRKEPQRFLGLGTFEGNIFVFFYSFLSAL